MGSIPGLADEKHSSSSSKSKRSSCSSSLKSSSSSSSTRSSSSSSLLLSSSSPTSTGPPSSLRSMDDLWQDINLSSLCPPAATSSSAVHGDANLQDFLGGGRGGGGPFNEDPTPSSRKNAYDPDPSSSSWRLAPGSGLQNREKGARVGATSRARSHRASGGVSPACNVCTTKTPSDAHVKPPAPATVPPPLKRKSSMENNGESSDRRFQRLMKNRESAERSRARKQAYMMELEIEVERLHEENDRLRREQNQVSFPNKR
ncbi:protein FD-like isoform X2 [Syzygium oleosum]|uniref:protein FD-like isoform X2 n=1 Tax=Syzygium oleosum TaxID=219896 RepID=UPI0024BBAACC|nr:protein FD-like isoform X2 [Syzygium oleosum]